MTAGLGEGQAGHQGTGRSAKPRGVAPRAAPPWCLVKGTVPGQTWPPSEPSSELGSLLPRGRCRPRTWRTPCGDWLWPRQWAFASGGARNAVSLGLWTRRPGPHAPDPRASFLGARGSVSNSSSLQGPRALDEGPPRPLRPLPDLIPFPQTLLPTGSHTQGRGGRCRNTSRGTRLAPEGTDHTTGQDTPRPVPPPCVQSRARSLHRNDLSKGRSARTGSKIDSLRGTCNSHEGEFS